MKKTIYFGLAVVLTVIFVSCKSDNVTNPGNGITSLDTGSFTYPFNIGNSWSFIYIASVSDIHPDSIRHYFSEYPLTRTGTVTILYDTLINGIQTRCLCETINDTQLTHQSRSYLINNDTALLMYAQRGMGSFPPLYLSDKVLYNLDFGTDETIRIYDPPFAVLKYPVVTGKTWHAFGDSTVKKYERYELIIIGAGTFNCMKTSTVYSVLPESPYYDFYCKYGLLKRSVFFDNVVITNEWYPEGIGTADITSTFTVNSFNIR